MESEEELSLWGEGEDGEKSRSLSSSSWDFSGIPSLSTLEQLSQEMANKGPHDAEVQLR